MNIFDEERRKKEKGFFLKRLAWKGKYFAIFLFFFLPPRNKGREERARWRELVSQHGALFSPDEINGRIGVYRNVFDVVLAEYKQRCYRYEWPLDRSKDRFHWSTALLSAIFHLVETEVTHSRIVAVHRRLSTDREKHSSLEKQRLQQHLRICIVFYFEREKKEKKTNLNLTLIRESLLRNFFTIWKKILKFDLRKYRPQQFMGVNQILVGSD